MGFATFALLAAGLPVADASAAEALYRFAAVGQWILPATPDYDAPEPKDQISNGTWSLAVDRQINVTADGDDTYLYAATKVLNAAGVEEESQLNLEVDPSYQTLDIHFLRVRRGATTLDVRPGARITALPQETQLRERVYDGSYNVNILLADVRPGDVVEFAYTMHSREKLFPGHFATSLTMGWSAPVHWHRVRVRAPPDRPIRAKLSDGSATPDFVARNGARELLMERHDLAAIPGEDDRPGWYSPWPRLFISDFKDWGEVARGVDPLFAPALRATAPVAELAREIAKDGGSPEQIALRALQFVQEQVSYVSIAIGAGAYRPTQPDTVLQRRYGDCKDKSVLLVMLLSQLHISAQPALVNTRRGRILGDMLPTPFAFNHAIVRMQIGEHTYWVDGTDAKQYAPLSVGAQPDYENALLVGAASDRLVPMPRPSPDLRRKEITATLDLRAGLDQPGKLTIVTRYPDAMADEIRSTLARKSLEKRRAEYLDYITRYYPSAKSAGPLQVSDDKARDIIEVRESYTLASAFEDGKKERVLNLHADELYRYGDTISSTERRAPLALEYPIVVRQHVIALLPEPWPVKPAGLIVGNPAFTYRGDVSYSDRKVELKYEYQALKDQVAPLEMKQYLVDRESFYDDLGYVLRKPKGSVARVGSQRSKFEQPLLAIFVLSTILVGWVLRSLHRWSPEPRAALATAPRGIGGWLVLPAIVAITGPVVTLVTCMVIAFAAPVETWQATLIPAVLIAASAALFGIQCTLLSLFFGRRTSVPSVYIAAAWLTVACSGGVSAWLVSAHDSNATLLSVMGAMLAGSAPAFLFAVIGTLYMHRSERVRTTFQRIYIPYERSKSLRTASLPG